MVTLQDLIHHLEVGAGMKSFNRTLLWASSILAVLLVLGAYDLRAYRNFASQEAMDAAQVGRNLAQGRGYTTLFVRPLSIYLIEQHAQETRPENAGVMRDPALIRTNHPDLANPPVYPVIL